MRVVVGRVGRAHGLAGDVAVALRTDDPDLRFGVGARLYPSATPHRRGLPAVLEVSSSRWHSGRLLVRFSQCPDRTAVEALAGVILEADVDVSAPGGDPDQFHDLALVGLSVTAPDGSAIGSVVGVIHLPGQDLLEIAAAGSTGEPFLVPFVHALVPVVDLAAGVLVVDLPAGLGADSDAGDHTG